MRSVPIATPAPRVSRAQDVAVGLEQGRGWAGCLWAAGGLRRQALQVVGVEVGWAVKNSLCRENGMEGSFVFP